MRNCPGRVLILVPSEVHKELAREAFEKGRSII
jgi:predicted dehydrogenase